MLITVIQVVATMEECHRCHQHNMPGWPLVVLLSSLSQEQARLVWLCSYKSSEWFWNHHFEVKNTTRCASRPHCWWRVWWRTEEKRIQAIRLHRLQAFFCPIMCYLEMCCSEKEWWYITFSCLLPVVVSCLHCKETKGWNRDLLWL